MSVVRYARILGLSDEEALMYETLLMLGPMPAGELAVGLDLRTNVVYSLLRRLAHKGFVTSRRTWPRTHEAYPLTLTLMQIRTRWWTEFRELEKLAAHKAFTARSRNG